MTINEWKFWKKTNVHSIYIACDIYSLISQVVYWQADRRQDDSRWRDRVMSAFSEIHNQVLGVGEKDQHQI